MRRKEEEEEGRRRRRRRGKREKISEQIHDEDGSEKPWCFGGIAIGTTTSQNYEDSKFQKKKLVTKKKEKKGRGSEPHIWAPNLSSDGWRRNNAHSWEWPVCVCVCVCACA